MMKLRFKKQTLILLVSLLCGIVLLCGLVFIFVFVPWAAEMKDMDAHREMTVSVVNAINGQIVFLSQRVAEHSFDERKVLELLGASDLPLVDDWGNEFRTTCTKGKIVISSAGQDLMFETPDDVVGTYERNDESEWITILGRHVLSFSAKSWEPAFEDAAKH